MILKRLSPIHWIAFVLLSQINWPYSCESISRLYSISLIIRFIHLVLYWLDCYIFVNLKIKCSETSNFSFSKVHLLLLFLSIFNWILESTYLYLQKVCEVIDYYLIKHQISSNCSISWLCGSSWILIYITILLEYWTLSVKLLIVWLFFIFLEMCRILSWSKISYLQIKLILSTPVLNIFLDSR